MVTITAVLNNNNKKDRRETLTCHRVETERRGRKFIFFFPAEQEKN